MLFNSDILKLLTAYAYRVHLATQQYLEMTGMLHHWSDVYNYEHGNIIS